MARVALLIALVFGALEARAQSVDPYQNLNNTWMHFHLSSGYSVRQDLTRTRAYMERFRFDAAEDEEKKDDDDFDIFMIFRGDRVPTIPGRKDAYTFLTYGFTFVQPLEDEDEGFGWEGSIGLGMVDRETEQGTSTKLVNFLIAAQGTYGKWLTLGFDFTANLLATGSNVLDVDQLSLYGRVPFLGAFTDVRYDLGSQQVRSVETGLSYDFTEKKLGIVTAAYYHRAPYLITGDIFPGVFELAGQVDYVVAGEHGGLARWQRVGPWGGDAFGVVGGAGVALGTNDGALRFGYGDLGFQYEMVRAFARVGAAYARLQKTHVVGGAGGVEVYLWDGDAVIEASLGRRDVNVVDRAGDHEGVSFTLSVSGAFR